MNAHTPNRRSLLERASDVYNFSSELRIKPRTDAFLDTLVPDMPAPAPAPLPIERRIGAAKIDRAALREAGFIMPDAAQSTLAEEFRIVKRALLLTASAETAQPRDRLVLVASAQPNEGKTFCSVNLALSLSAEKDFEVVLVDADFAKPEVLSTLGLAAGPGMMDAIAEPSIDVESCIIATDVPGLSVLPAGRHSNEATEMLASERTRAILDRLVEHRRNRIVIFDSAPLLAASMGSQLAQSVGQALLVVRADKTGEADLKEAVALLQGCANVRLLLNGASFHRKGRRFGSYYGLGE